MAWGAALQLFRLSKLRHPWPDLGTCGGKVGAMSGGGATKARMAGTITPWPGTNASRVGPSDHPCSLFVAYRAILTAKPRPYRKEGTPMELTELPTKEAAIIARLDIPDHPPLS